jgi:hypothetical protein
MQSMAGLAPEQTDQLVADVYAAGGIDPARRRVVGPYRTVLMVLIYLRQNLPQALIAELFGCSQPTVSRWIGRLAPIIVSVLTPAAEHRAERELRSTVRVDGFLAPIGDRRHDTFTAGTYSGKRHRCGFNIQVVGSAHGRLVLVGDPQPGRMHDAKAWHACGLAARFTGRLHADGGPGGFADTAYRATGLTTPRPKTPGQDRTQSQIEYNRAIASRRASVERVIAPPQELANARHRLPRNPRPVPAAPGHHRQAGDLPNIRDHLLNNALRLAHPKAAAQFRASQGEERLGGLAQRNPSPLSRHDCARRACFTALRGTGVPLGASCATLLHPVNGSIGGISAFEQPGMFPIFGSPNSIAAHD